MKTLRTYGNLNEAFLAQAWLDSCGIAALIPDENTASGALPHVSIYSGIRLQVAEEDFDRAVVLMRDFAASNGRALRRSRSCRGRQGHRTEPEMPAGGRKFR